MFRERLTEAMARTVRGPSRMALMFLDLDRFKVVNDSLGHEVGDRLPQHVTQTLPGCVRRVKPQDGEGPVEAATAARLGGDEFTVIVEGLTGQDDATVVARRILDRLAEPFYAGCTENFVSASIGITMYPFDATDLDGLIRHADLAMYRSKELGRNTLHFHSGDLDHKMSERLALEMNLRHALEGDEFVPHYQPKAKPSSGHVTGVEALLRWDSPDKGLVAPDTFIALLEDTGLIVPVGTWVIRGACMRLAAWDREGVPPMNMAVNLSARQFQQTGMLDVISQALHDAGIAPQRLGTPDDPEDSAITTAVIALGQGLGLNVVAEGVENLAQAGFLRDLGCDEIQGYLLSRPMVASSFASGLLNYGDPVAARVSTKPLVLGSEAPASVFDNVVRLRRR